MSNKTTIASSDTPAMFLLEADRDYIIARLVSFTGGAFGNKAGYLSQQALENYLKAVSVQRSGKYLKIHDLKELAAYCAQFDKDFSDTELLKDLTIFDNFAEVGRYGGEAAYDPLAIRTPIITTAGVWVWTDDYRKKLDTLVFKIRGKLDFSKINQPDHLQAILKGDHTLLTDTWQFPIKLREVLAMSNDYFK